MTNYRISVYTPRFITPVHTVKYEIEEQRETVNIYGAISLDWFRVSTHKTIKAAESKLKKLQTA